jgi:hypothetical protein
MNDPKNRDLSDDDEMTVNRDAEVWDKDSALDDETDTTNEVGNDYYLDTEGGE